MEAWIHRKWNHTSSPHAFAVCLKGVIDVTGTACSVISVIVHWHQLNLPGSKSWICVQCKSLSYKHFLALAQETQQIPTEEVQLEIYLSNGQKVKINILTSDQTEDVLEVRMLYSVLCICRTVFTFLPLQVCLLFLWFLIRITPLSSGALRSFWLCITDFACELHNSVFLIDSSFKCRHTQRHRTIAFYCTSHPQGWPQAPFST